VDFETLTIKDRTRLLRLLSSTHQRAIDYLDGRQLGPAPGNTTYWSGPMLPPTHPRYAEMQAALLKSFSYRNVIREVAERQADAATGEEPDWGVTLARPLQEGETPTPDEQARIDELNAALTTWWDREGLPTLIQETATRLVAFGRTPTRFVIPPRYLTQDGTLTLAPTPDDALRRLRLTPAPEQSSGIITDPDTLDDIAVTAYETTDANGRRRDELEVSYVDERGLTVLRVLTDDAAQEVRLPLGGRLWLTEAKLTRGLVSDDLLSQQDALNVALTMLSRNTHFAGFVERYGVGIEPPTDQDGNPVPLNIGPGTANFFQPSSFTETRTENGVTTSTERPASATYGRFEPTSPTALTAAVNYAEASMYAIARQRFVLMSDSATASGRSREVAAGDHLTAAGRTARAIERWLRDTLEFAAHFAGVMTGQPGRYADLRVSVTCRVRVFTPAPEDRAADLAAVQAGVMSRETAMTRAAIPDPEAELQRIQAEQATEPSAAPLVEGPD